MTTLAPRATGPWYREPWPWLLMLGPALVVAGASYTAWLAITSADGLVADDYYTQGLAINRRLARDAAAATMGLQAVARFERGSVSVEFKGKGLEMEFPPTLTLTLVHPTRAGLDQTVVLEKQAGAAYTGRTEAPAPGRWLVAVEQPQWRLTGRWQVPSDGRVELRSER